MAYLELTQAFSLTSFGGNRQRGAYRRIGNEGELEFLLSAGNAITIYEVASRNFDGIYTIRRDSFAQADECLYRNLVKIGRASCRERV